MTEQSKPIIGYSVFDVFEECYEYDEDACYIADADRPRVYFDPLPLWCSATRFARSLVMPV